MPFTSYNPNQSNFKEVSASDILIEKYKKEEQSKAPSLTNTKIGKLPVIKQATEFGVGVGTELGKAGLGLGQAFLKGANVVGNVLGTGHNQYNPIIDNLEKIKQEVYQKPFEKELETIPAKAGELTADVALFAQGNKPIIKGQEALTGAVKGMNIASKPLAYGATKVAQVLPEIAGTGATQYAISGGDKKSAVQTGLTAGAFSFLTHVGSDIYKSLIPQTVKENVARVFTPKGKIALNQTMQKTDDAVSALETIKRMSPDIKVVDLDGVEKAFDPKKATFIEMPQVLSQSKQKIYDAYTKLATEAGDSGAIFTADDFNKVISKLDDFNKPGFTPAFSSKANQIKEAITRFEGQTATPGEVQKLIEAINLDVNPLSDKAGAKVAQEASQTLRELLDSKITGATGEGYQQLRTAYSQLKSIEPEILNQFKKAMRQSGATPDIIDSIASVDAITSILTGQGVGVVRGGVIEAVKNAYKHLKSPENNLRRAFKLIDEIPAETSTRFGNTVSSTSAKQIYSKNIANKALPTTTPSATAKIVKKNPIPKSSTKSKVKSSKK